MTTAEEHELLPMLLRWVAQGERYAFQIEYGYGVCEVPWITLSNNCKEIWCGTFTEFAKWVKA